MSHPLWSTAHACSPPPPPGFAVWGGEADMGFWNDGLTLLKVSQADYVLFYRLLGERVGAHVPGTRHAPRATRHDEIH